MKKVTALIPTFNEEDNLRDCLASVAWADEILVVDSFSTDNTLEIARQSGARIIQREYGSHASQRNWAIPQAANEWILLLDSDERVSVALKDNIQTLLHNDPDNHVYIISRKNYFFGHEINHGSWGHDRIVRFFHRDTSRIEEYGHHGDVILDQTPGVISGEIIHLTYRSVDDYFRKFQMYTTEGAKVLYRKNKQSSIIKLLFSPIWRFTHMYFIRLGFLDGLPGLLICILSAFYVFTKYFKLWYYHNVSAPEK